MSSLLSKEDHFNSNRAFLYGDGIFESFLLIDKRIPLFSLHFERMKDGLTGLGIETPPNLGKEALQSEILDHCLNERQWTNAVLRLTAFRRSEGGYSPSRNELGLHLKASPIAESDILQLVGPIKTGIYRKEKKGMGELSPYKTCSSLLYVMASRWAEENKLDDALIINNSNEIIESSNSNLYLLRGKSIILPSISSGPVDGIMRKVLQVVCTWMPYDWKELDRGFTLEEIHEADELFLTNSIRGLRSIVDCEGKDYDSRIGNLLAEALREYIMSI